jgi:hypothetical protein
MVRRENFGSATSDCRLKLTSDRQWAAPGNVTQRLANVIP